MSLFSKLFSRDDKQPGESRDENAQATSSDTDERSRQPNDAAAGGAAARATQATAAVTGKTEQTSVATSGDKKGQGPQPEAAGGKQPGASGAKDPRVPTPGEGTAKAPPLKPGATVKRDRVQTRTMQGMGTIPNASPPRQQPPAATPPEPATTPRMNPAARAAPSPAPRADVAPPRKPAPTVPIAEERTEPRTEPRTPATNATQIVDLPSAEIPTLQVKTISVPPPQKGTPHFDAAFDAAMDAILNSNAPPPLHPLQASDEASDRRAVAATFADVAKLHAHPLRELMFQLGVGRTPRQWASASRPVLRPLLDAAQQIGLLELVGALGALDAALERAAAEPTACIGEHAAESLRSAYDRLCRQMPDAFTPPANNDGRRMILLESLLLQIPDLQRRTLAKLYAAGLNSLGQLSQASPDELCAVAGLERPLAESVVEHVQRFERERSNINPGEQRSQACERLRGLVQRLSQLQSDFERAEHEESVEKKRLARRGREAALLELDLVFAEIGEVSVIEELKRYPMQAKIRRVSNYLDEQRASA